MYRLFILEYLDYHWNQNKSILISFLSIDRYIYHLLWESILIHVYYLLYSFWLIHSEVKSFPFIKFSLLMPKESFNL